MPFLDDLQKIAVLNRLGSTPHDIPKFGTTSLNPLIIIKRNDFFKNVLNARHFKSNFDQSSESWPLELLATQLAKEKKKYKSALALLYANEHATLNDAAIKQAGFSSGDKLLAFIRRFIGLKSIPIFLQNKRPSSSIN